jgi:flagellar motor component MotA
MLPVAGILIVVGAVAGGFLLESGDVSESLQPAELLIIFGSACDLSVRAAARSIGHRGSGR